MDFAGDFTDEYWQQYLEGLRLAEAGRWQEARQKLDLFFDNNVPLDIFERERYLEARQFYRTEIFPEQGERGLRAYRKICKELSRQDRKRKAKLKVLASVIIVSMAVVTAFWSAIAFGNWWVIFLLIPVALVVVIVALIASGGISFN